MYAYARPPGRIHEDEEIAYWRKHNALHNWMQMLAFEKDIHMPEGQFNCVELRLTEKDLDDLEQTILNKELKPTGGFFFGATDYDPNEYADEDLAFIKKAREFIKKGYLIYYDSWW